MLFPSIVIKNVYETGYKKVAANLVEDTDRKFLRNPNLNEIRLQH
jgi:hypothetical protein